MQQQPKKKSQESVEYHQEWQGKKQSKYKTLVQPHHVAYLMQYQSTYLQKDIVETENCTEMTNSCLMGRD